MTTNKQVILGKIAELKAEVERIEEAEKPWPQEGADAEFYLTYSGRES